MRKLFVLGLVLSSLAGGYAIGAVPQNQTARVTLKIPQTAAWSVNFMASVQSQICPSADSQLELTGPDICDADYDFWVVSISRQGEVDLIIDSEVDIIGSWGRTPKP